jgi:hypothetical protein
MHGFAVLHAGPREQLARHGIQAPVHSIASISACTGTRRLQRYGTLHAVTARSTGPVYQKTWIYRESFTDVHARQLLFFGVSILGHAVTHQQVLSLSRTSQGKKPTSKNITHSVSLDLDRYGVLRHRLRDSSS